MATERLANLGYLLLGKQSAPNVMVTPTIAVPYYNETLTTSMNFTDQQPIYGGKFATMATLQGQRSHKGDFTTIAEPNTTGYFLDMLLTRSTSLVIYTFTVTSANATIGATFSNNSQTFTVLGTIAAGTTLIATGTGAPTASGTLTKVTGTGDTTITYSVFSAGPTQHAFGLSATTNPNPYTVDISTGNVVKRFWGVQASNLAPNWNGTELQWKVTVNALGSFQGREIGTIATTTVTLSTAYDPAPTTGLVVGDLVRVYKSTTGATLDTTVATIAGDGVTITLGASAAAFAPGDMLYLRPQTISLNLLPSFIWPKTQFQYGATAAAATVATQSRIEQGSTFELIHSFNSDGEPRSGGFDPASLVRKTGDINVSIKRFFDTPEDIQNMNSLAKTALVIRHLSGLSNQYEMRVIVNHLATDDAFPVGKADEILYSDMKYHTDYDQTDAQGYSVLLNSALTTY